MPLPSADDVSPLEWIVFGMPFAEFVGGALGARHVISRGGDTNRFATLLTIGELDAVLGTYGLRIPDIRLVQADRELPADQYAWRGSLADPMRVARLFSEGATVVFGALHERHDRLHGLCAAVGRQVGARTQANIYLTPPGSQGFKAHWDTHDVYVLQVEGTKRWRLYEGGLEHPLPTHNFDVTKDLPGAVTDEFLLNAGDSLYIPRGLMHAADTTSDRSIHVTLGVIPYTWAELLEDCIREAALRLPSLRRNVPFGLSRGPAMIGTLAETLRDAADLAISEEAITAVVAARLEEFGAAHRARGDDFLRQAIEAEHVAVGDRIRLRNPDLSWLEERPDGLSLTSGERQIEFPSGPAGLVRELFEPGTAKQPDEVPWDERRAAIISLIREGVAIRDRD